MAEATAGSTAEVLPFDGLQFRLLGPLQLLRDGQDVPLGGPQQRAVFALLLLHPNQMVSLEQMVDRVWASHPSDGAVTTTRTYIHHLRHALEPDRPRGAAATVLVTEGRGYVLRVDRSRVDAIVFQKRVEAGRAALDRGEWAHAADELRRALGMWRGQALADLAEYEFVRAEADRLEQLRLAGLELRIAADLALGRHQVLTGELEQLIAEHPFREGLRAQLMLAYYRCGRQADALAAYDRARELLADELGIDPGEELQRLHAAVLHHDPALTADLPTAAILRIGARAPRGSQAPLTGTRGRLGLRHFRLVRLHRRDLAVSARSGPSRNRWARGRVLVAGIAAVLAASLLGGTAFVLHGRGTALAGDAVGLLDVGSGAVTAMVGMPGPPSAIAASAEGLWVVSTTGNSVALVDGQTRQVRQTVTVGTAPTAVTAWGPDVWVVNSGDGTLTRINAAALRVVGAPIRVGGSPDAVVADGDGAYVANATDGTVVHVDGATSEVGPAFPVGSRPSALVLGFGSLWVGDVVDNTVLRLDPVTGAVQRQFSVGAGPVALLVAAGSVWAANSLDATVSRIDPTTGRVLTVRVGDGPSGLAASGGRIWVADVNDGTLARIDPGSGHVTLVRADDRPVALSAAGSQLWVAGRRFASGSHRGGTLTVLGDGGQGTFDPALNYGTMTMWMLGLVYDGLVSIRPAPGAAGYQLVPDLALALPQVSPDGRTYTFYLRRGIRYSDGRVVAPEDFRRAIQRELILPPQDGNIGSPDYYRGILGAADCRPHQPETCPLTAGIITDDTTYSVTFRLSSADSSFLGKLALTLVAAAPPGAPWRDVGSSPYPGTGPYRVLSGDVRTGLMRLVRNPRFRPWSTAAQPDGFPDQITLLPPDRAPDTTSTVAAVKAGTVDVAQFDWGATPAVVLSRLQISYPTRVLTVPTGQMLTLYLNNRRAPFNDVHARRALNYAMDRAVAARLLGSDGPACQLVPPGFPGYAPMCAYSAHRDGSYAVDPASAAREMRKTKPYPGTLEVYTLPFPAWRAVATRAVATLKGLGYHARLRVYDGNNYFQLVTAKDSPADVALYGWGADVPAESQYFDPILSCPAAALAASSTGFCDQRLDTLMREAEAAEVAQDKVKARALWTQLYRAVDAAAPLVPLAATPQQIFVSARVGNAGISCMRGPLFDQMWVR